MNEQNEVPSRCATCGSSIALRDGRAVCAHNERHVALGGPGSGWHAEQGHVPGSQGGDSSAPHHDDEDTTPQAGLDAQRAASPAAHKEAAAYHADQDSPHHQAAAALHLRAAKDPTRAADARDASKAAHMDDTGTKLPAHDFYGRWRMRQVEDDGSYLSGNAARARAHESAGGQVQQLSGQDPSGGRAAFYHLKPGKGGRMPAVTATPFTVVGKGKQ